ncbi:hypothetical protein WCX72_04700 [Sulfurimonas sp. HSL1-6]|uniref:hypothetical protein n=1 Tax=Thiomicrolovo immobilis TaxID=3131935 RepID=UPI0031F757CD
MNYIVISLIAYLLLFNTVSTFRLAKTEMYDSSQKVFQSLVIWLLPLIGAAIISHFLNDEPLVLSEKASKYVLLIKLLLLPLMIKVKSNLDDEIGNSNEGYQADFMP